MPADGIAVVVNPSAQLNHLQKIAVELLWFLVCAPCAKPGYRALSAVCRIAFITAACSPAKCRNEFCLILWGQSKMFTGTNSVLICVEPASVRLAKPSCRPTRHTRLGK